jgi:hypothetical protein
MTKAFISWVEESQKAAYMSYKRKTERKVIGLRTETQW